MFLLTFNNIQVKYEEVLYPRYCNKNIIYINIFKYLKKYIIYDINNIKYKNNKIWRRYTMKYYILNKSLLNSVLVIIAIIIF